MYPIVRKDLSVALGVNSKNFGLYTQWCGLKLQKQGKHPKKLGSDS